MATTNFTITKDDTDYVNVGTGPCLVDIRGRGVGRVATGSSAPASSTEAFHLVTEDQPFSYAGTDNVYVRAAPGAQAQSFPVIVST